MPPNPQQVKLLNAISSLGLAHRCPVQILAQLVNNSVTVLRRGQHLNADRACRGAHLGCDYRPALTAQHHQVAVLVAALGDDFQHAPSLIDAANSLASGWVLTRTFVPIFNPAGSTSNTSGAASCPMAVMVSVSEINSPSR